MTKTGHTIICSPSRAAAVQSAINRLGADAYILTTITEQTLYEGSSVSAATLFSGGTSHQTGSEEQQTT